MAKKSVKEQKLDDLESQFRPLLVACLEECGRGRWGLFGEDDSPELAKCYSWSEAEELKRIAVSIRALRAEFGQPSLLVERYLHYASLRGANLPSEPKLARAFSDEIQRNHLDTKPL